MNQINPSTDAGKQKQLLSEVSLYIIALIAVRVEIYFHQYNKKK